jgi:hypothetical protein
MVSEEIRTWLRGFLATTQVRNLSSLHQELQPEVEGEAYKQDLPPLTS